MEISLSTSLQAKLNRIASESDRDMQALIEEAIKSFVEYQEWFLRKVAEGLTAADEGRCLDHEEIAKLIDERYPGQ